MHTQATVSQLVVFEKSYFVWTKVFDELLAWTIGHYGSNGLV